MLSDPISDEESPRTMYQLILDQISALRKEQQNGFSSMRTEFNERIGRLVASDMLVAEQRRVDDKFEAVHKELEEGERRYRRLTSNVKWALGVVGVPVLLFGLDLLSRRL